MKKYKYKKTITIEGKKYQIYADTLTQLGQKMEKKRLDVENEQRKVSGHMTLTNWAYTCIDTYKTNQKDVTRRKYEYRIKHCILDHIGSMQLKDIKPLHCQSVLNLQNGMSKTQVNEVYQALKFIFGKAVDNELIKKDPTTGLVRPSGYRNKRRALTSNERKYFIEVGMTDRRYYYYLLMLYCGCRPSEAANVQGKDVVTKDGFPMLHIRGTKTGNADRHVPIPPEFYEMIKSISPFEYIAQTKTGGKISESNRSRIWKSYTREINLAMGCKTYRNALVPPFPLAQDIVPYCLRHEFCTELARKGIDIRIAQKLMGHADVKLTANIYTNLQAEDLQGAIETLYGEGNYQGNHLKSNQR